jgi:tetratricopeptide (TPR) repeat protein
MTLRLSLTIVAWFLVTHHAYGQFVAEQERREAWEHYRTGRELMSAERFEKAAEAFRQAVEKDNLLTLGHHGLGEAYMALKRFASAIQAFTNCRVAFLTLHGLREKDRVDVERRREEEIRELNDTIRRLRQMPNTSLRIVKVEAQIQDLERQKSSNTGGFLSPPELSLALGSAYFRNGQLDDAEREWNSAVAVNSRLGEAHNNLAALYAMTDRKKEAENAVRAAERSGFRVHPQLKDDIRAMPK